MSEEAPTSQIEATIRRAGEAEFSAPVPVSGPGFPEETDIAVAPDGSVTVVWKERTSPAANESVIKISTMVSGSETFADPEIISEPGFHNSPPRVAAKSDGGVLVAWDRDASDEESRIFVASITDHSSKPLVQELTSKADHDEFGRPSHPLVVTGLAGEAIVTWNTTWNLHWVFQQASSNPQEWSKPSRLHEDTTYDMVLHSDGLAIVPTWEAVESDDDWEEDLGVVGEGEIWLNWMNASPGEPDRKGSNWIIEGESVEGPKVALGSDGTLALVFRQHHELRVEVWSPGEDWEDRVERLSLEPPDEEESFQLLVGPEGEVTVIWLGDSVGNCPVSATRPGGSKAFETSGELRKVSKGTSSRELRADSDPSGAITVCWLDTERVEPQAEHEEKRESVISVVRPSGDAKFSEPVRVGGPSEKIGSLSMNTGYDGTTAIVWAAERRG